MVARWHFGGIWMAVLDYEGKTTEPNGQRHVDSYGISQQPTEIVPEEDLLRRVRSGSSNGGTPEGRAEGQAL